AVLFVLRDVGSGDEGFVAFTLEHDHAYLGIPLEAVEHLRDRLPHVDGDGVPPGGIVEGEPADRPLFFGDDALAERACREGRLLPECEKFFLGHEPCSFDETAIVMHCAGAKEHRAASSTPRAVLMRRPLPSIRPGAEQIGMKDSERE